MSVRHGARSAEDSNGAGGVSSRIPDLSTASLRDLTRDDRGSVTVLAVLGEPDDHPYERTRSFQSYI